MKCFRLDILAVLIFLCSTIGFGQEPIKFDEFGSLECEDYQARLDFLANEIRDSDGKLYGFVVIYEGKYSRYIYSKNSTPMLKSFLPVLGEAIFRGELMREYLVKDRGILKSQLMIVNGGFRDYHAVEFWLVSRNGKIPPIIPTLETMKYREGTPTGICDGI